MRLGQATRVGQVRRSSESGYAMAALLVGMSVLAVLMSMALPVWSQFAKREKEEELIWRGQQYARAVGLFQRKYANTFPPTVDILVEQKFLRKKYKDPITNQDFQPIPAGGGTIAGASGSQIGARPGGGPPGGNQPTTTLTAQSPSGAQAQLTSRAGGESGVSGGQAIGPRGPNQPSIGIQGVVSKSGESSIKIYNGRTRYNEWAFVYIAATQRIGPGGVQRPGVGPQGQPGQGRPPGPGNPFGGPGMTQPGPGGPPPFGMPRPNSPGQPPQRPPDR